MQKSLNEHSHDGFLKTLKVFSLRSYIALVVLFGVYGCGNIQCPVSAQHILVLLYCGCRPACSTQSAFSLVFTNESIGWNNASAEPETQWGVFHLSASLICHGWGSRSPCLHKAPPPL